MNNKAFMKGVTGSMQDVWACCEWYWSIINSEKAHSIYAFIGVGLGLLCVGMIKLGMYARDCWEESKIDEEPGTVEVMSSPAPEQVVKRVAVRYCREFREFVTRLNKVTKREIMIAHHAWSIVWR